MDPTVPTMVRGEARGLVSKTLIEVLRALTMSIFDTPNLGDRVEEILIVAAIVVGQAEGRLMCASDIANYVGLPRATVIRKLRTVDMARMLGKAKQGNRACYYIKDPNNEKGLVHVRKAMFALKQCCEQLSKMDTPKLDSSQVSEYPR